MTGEQLLPVVPSQADPDRGWVKNAAGVKDEAECYRTIAGVRWQWFAEDVGIFKAAGLRHRKGPDGEGAFIHPDDFERAFAAIDAGLAANRSPKP